MYYNIYYVDEIRFYYAMSCIPIIGPWIFLHNLLEKLYSLLLPRYVTMDTVSKMAAGSAAAQRMCK